MLLLLKTGKTVHYPLLITAMINCPLSCALLFQQDCDNIYYFLPERSSDKIMYHILLSLNTYEEFKHKTSKHCFA